MAQNRKLAGIDAGSPIFPGMIDADHFINAFPGLAIPGQGAWWHPFRECGAFRGRHDAG
jgi:hypothetical protein